MNISIMFRKHVMVIGREAPIVIFKGNDPNEIRKLSEVCRTVLSNGATFSEHMQSIIGSDTLCFGVVDWGGLHGILIPEDKTESTYRDGVDINDTSADPTLPENLLIFINIIRNLKMEENK